MHGLHGRGYTPAGVVDAAPGIDASAVASLIEKHRILLESHAEQNVSLGGGRRVEWSDLSEVVGWGAVEKKKVHQGTVLLSSSTRCSLEASSCVS